MNARRIAVVTAAAAAAVAALAACSPNTTVSTTTEAPRAVTVTATGTATVVPDAARAQITIVGEDPESAQAAQAEAATATTAVLEALAANGVAEADIATSGLSVGPTYTYADNTQTLTGYQATQSLTVTLRDLATAGTTLDAAVQAGGNTVRVDSFSAFVTDPTATAVKAREQAVAIATAQAEQYAQLLGFSLDGVTSVQESSTSAPPPVAFDMAQGAAESAPSTPVSAGTTEVSVTVTVSWAIG